MSSCRLRWQTQLLPILKTHSLGLHKFPFRSSDYFQWMTDVLRYITEQRINEVEEVDFHYLEKELCPGQTFGSINEYVRNLIKTEKKRVLKSSESSIVEHKTLHELCSKRLNGPKARCGPSNEKWIKLKMKHVEKIVKIYKVIINTNVNQE